MLETFARVGLRDSIVLGGGEVGMPRKRVGQLGFLDVRAGAARGSRADRLGEIARLIDWSRIEAALGWGPAARKGEPSWPPLVLFRALLLQRWYDLSDPGLEEALFDRLSFRAFCGLSLEDDVPDHTTIWRFRERLTEGGAMEAVFADLQRQLDERGVLIKRGTLVDASLLQAAARRPRLEEGRESPVDPDARFGAANERGRYTFGYKLHVGVDEGSLLVRAGHLTPGNVQEIDVAVRLVAGDEGAVIADRGYDGARLRDHLARRGIANGLMRRAGKGRPLSPQEVKANQALSLRRRPVEAVFGTLKRCYRLGRVRYFNLARNAVALNVALFAFNLRRLHALSAP